MVLNCRPLTYTTTDNLDEHLTPSHMLVGQQLMNYAGALAVNHEVNSDEKDCQLSAQLKHLNHSLDAFWKRWRREYLLELRKAHRHHHNNGKPQIAEGDVVVVFTEDQPHSCCSLERTDQLITGADKQMRAATVRMSRKGRVSVLDRPIQHLHPPKVVSPSNSTFEEGNEDNGLDEEPVSKTQTTCYPRPRRSAAVRARDQILAQAISGTDIEL